MQRLSTKFYSIVMKKLVYTSGVHYWLDSAGKNIVF